MTRKLYIDKSPPVVNLGIGSGYYNYDLTFVPMIEEKNLEVSSIVLKKNKETLGEYDFGEEINISEEGRYLLIGYVRDLAGNETSEEAEIVLDKTPPAIDPGIQEGYYNTDLIFAPSVLDMTTAIGQIYVSWGGSVAQYQFGEQIHLIDEAEYFIDYEANDLAGNISKLQIKVVIDKTSPVIQISGVEDGAYYNENIVLTATVIDEYLDLSSELLEINDNSYPFDSQLAFTEEGRYQLIALATDLAGNEADPIEISFVIDKTPPELEITFSDGVITNQSINFSAKITEINRDLSKEFVKIYYNNKFVGKYSFNEIITLSQEGEYVVVDSATGLEGNSATISKQVTIDLTSPKINIIGINDGEYRNQDITLKVEINDGHRDAFLEYLFINNKLYPIDKDIILIKETEYHLVCTATDLAGNQSQLKMNFVLDKTPPKISIEGVIDGELYSKTVTPIITITDTYLDGYEITLNGESYQSGTPIGEDGDYLLSILAWDKAGNQSQAQVSFTIVRVVLDVSKSILAPHPWVLVWLREGKPHSMDPVAVGDWIEKVFSKAGIRYFIAENETTFVKEMRSGLYNVYLVVNMGKTRDINRELAGKVTSGDGLIIFKNHPEALPKVRELLGVHWLRRRAFADIHLVRLEESSLGPSREFTIVGKMSSVNIRPLSATTLGYYYTSWPNDPSPAITANPCGLGISMVFAFDPTTVVVDDQKVIDQIPIDSINYVCPAEFYLIPLSVAHIGLVIDNVNIPAQLQLEEIPGEGIITTWASDGATIENNHIFWYRKLDWNEHIDLSFRIRLPAEIGEHKTETYIRYLWKGSYRDYLSYPIILNITEDHWQILERAKSELAALNLYDKDDVNARDEALSLLEQVIPEMGNSLEGIEQAIDLIAEVLEKVDQIKGADTTLIKIDLGKCLNIWQAKAYLWRN